MDSRDIFRQYLAGAIGATAAIVELEKKATTIGSAAELQEVARARYVIGFIRRAEQFNNGEVTAKDLCLNIRDIVLFLGSIKLTTRLYNAVKECGSEFNLICEDDLQVSCIKRSPSWLAPQQYIDDVYALAYDGSDEMENSSAGDAMLVNRTGFIRYKSFEQKIAVHTALRLPLGHTLLVSLPTGGGKSLVTQLLASDSDGLTVVIVPTVALALDQYNAAQQNLRRKVAIYCYRGEQSATERVTIINAVRSKRAKLLFTSPEAILKNSELRSLLDSAAKNHYLANVVVDEAHVVPDWGVFFRPDFQLFAILLKKWRCESENYIRTFLLSATLSDDVVATIFGLFGTAGGNAQVRCDALRPEPRFYFNAMRSRQEQTAKTMEAIKLLPKPMVVYVLEPREARDLQQKLQEVGYENIPVFTGETRDTERARVLKGWKRHEFDVVIATSAFGIGVDKPDVRTIIHACCPENLSRFYQEVGRGGRDRLPSISLFLPYKSQHDSDTDVRRALGLVNKRVLTAERAAIRWQAMLADNASIIDGDECVVNTSATPATMSDEEAECAGNRNVAWNINLLLFLHRTGFIDLVDVSYVWDQSVRPIKKYYTVTIRLLQPEVLSDAELLVASLQEPRAKEYAAQMAGYRIIARLVATPKSICWGQMFRHLFPLARELCSGCPATPTGRSVSDDRFRLRSNPEIKLPPGQVSRRLARNMGSFNELIVSRAVTGAYSLGEVAKFATKAAENGIGVLVAPKEIAEQTEQITYDGLLLNYDEFYYVAEHCPYLLANGVVCVMASDASVNITLYKKLGELEAYGYRRVIYCNENINIASGDKTIKEYSDAYTISVQKF